MNLGQSLEINENLQHFGEEEIKLEIGEQASSREFDNSSQGSLDTSDLNK